MKTIRKILLLVFTSLVLFSLTVKANALEEDVEIKLSTTSQTAKLFSSLDVNKDNDLLSAVTKDAGKYNLKLESGDYKLFVYDESTTFVGSIKLKVTKENEKTGLGDLTERNHFLVCTLFETGVLNEGWIYNEDYTITFKVLPAGSGYERDVESSDTLNGQNIICYEGDSIVCTYTPSLSKNNFVKKSVAYTLNYSVSGNDTKTTIGEAVPVHFEVPKGAIVDAGILHTYFVYNFYEAYNADKSSEEKWVYSFMVPKGDKFFYRVSHEDGVTYWDYTKVSGESTIVVDGDKLNFSGNYKKSTIFTDYDHNRFDLANIYTNINYQNYLNLDINETFTLNVFRNFMAIEGTSNAEVALPDMHYRVIDINTGLESNVISLTVDEKNSSVATIKGLNKGVCAILVTYDAMTYEHGYVGKQFGAIAPYNTGLIVISVDEDGSSTNLNMTINERYGNTETVKLAGNNLDSEHDILFYTSDDGASFTFTKEEGATVEVSRAITTDVMNLTPFTSEGILTNGNEVTLTNLTSGRHIIKVTKDGVSNYQVVSTKKVSYVVYDKDNNEVYLSTGEKKVLFTLKIK